MQLFGNPTPHCLQTVRHMVWHILRAASWTLPGTHSWSIPRHNAGSRAARQRQALGACTLFASPPHTLAYCSQSPLLMSPCDTPCMHNAVLVWLCAHAANRHACSPQCLLGCFIYACMHALLRQHQGRQHCALVSLMCACIACPWGCLVCPSAHSCTSCVFACHSDSEPPLPASTQSASA